MKRLVSLLLFHLTLFSATAELPKDLRIATEMIQDGLGRDAASRISAWLEKTAAHLNPKLSFCWLKLFCSIIDPTKR